MANSSTILDHLIRVFEIITIGYGTVWFKDWIDRRRKEKMKASFMDNDIEDKIQPIVDHIREKTGAHIVALWEGSNGEVSLTGFHKKKLSILCESVESERYSSKIEMQNIPVSVFKRNVDLLRDRSENYIISNECELADQLADLHRNYDIGTLLIFKIYTGKIVKKWTDLLIVSFKECQLPIDSRKLAWLDLQSIKIGEILS